MKYLKICSFAVALLLLASPAMAAVECTLGTSLDQIRMESKMEMLDELTVTCEWTNSAADNTAVRVTDPAAGVVGGTAPTVATGAKFNLDLDLNGMLSEDADAPKLMLMDLDSTTGAGSRPTLTANNGAADGVKIPGIDDKGYRSVAGEVSRRSVLWAGVVYPAAWNVPAVGSEVAGSGTFKITGITVDASTVDGSRLEATIVVTGGTVDTDDDADIARVGQALDISFAEDNKANDKINACEPGKFDITIDIEEGYQSAWVDGTDIMLTTSSGKISAKDVEDKLNVVSAESGGDTLVIEPLSLSSSKDNTAGLKITFEPEASDPGDDLFLSAMLLPDRRRDESFIESQKLDVGTYISCTGDPLFFPFVTTMSGWDTGIVLVNDSKVDGSCSLNWGNMDLDDDEMEALSTIDVDAKDHMAFLVSMQRGADYSGSLGVKCSFSSAMGYVFLSDTANGIGQGYLVKP
ncbi:MAG: hypothetical protein OXL36_13310 [Bryobacterales bacterium]|nr:hypothetical protein [Bryobacterales bacterium]MDE0294530.1 hypothetical protein [Bryobacterales bacterium]